MELLPERNDAEQVVPMSSGSPDYSNFPRVSLEDSEMQDETQNEKTLLEQQSENASSEEADSSNKEQEAMTQENASNDNVRAEETNEAPDAQISAVTPLSMEESVARPVKTLDESVATNLESSSPETHSNGATGVNEEQSETTVHDGSNTEDATTTTVEPMNVQDVNAQVPSDQQPMPTSHESRDSHRSENEGASNSQTDFTNDEVIRNAAHGQEEVAAANEPMAMDTQAKTGETFDSHGGMEAMANGSHQSTEALTEPRQSGSEVETGDPPVITNVEASQETTGDETMEDIIQSIVQDAGHNDQPNDQNPGAALTANLHSGNDDGAQSDTSQLVDTEDDGAAQLEGADAAGEAATEGNPSSAAAPSVTAPSAASLEVIDLLDSDEEDSRGAQQQHFAPPAAKRQRTERAPTVSAGAAAASKFSSVVRTPNHPPTADHHGASYQQQFQLALKIPRYLPSVPGFVATWKNLLPTRELLRAQSQQNHQNRVKYYELSLLNVSEFTITGLRVGDEYSGYVTSVAGLRSHIKKISKGHGNAFFERDPDGGTGKWHIPLGAYHAFFGFLKSLPNHRVEGIDEAQLKIASLGKARLEKEYPSARKLVKMGVPKQLANALAPFQRGGVDFVIEKEGRALIADEMVSNYVRVSCIVVQRAHDLHVSCLHRVSARLFRELQAWLFTTKNGRFLSCVRVRLGTTGRTSFGIGLAKAVRLTTANTLERLMKS